MVRRWRLGVSGQQMLENVMGLSECVEGVRANLAVDCRSRLLLDGSDGTVVFLAKDAVDAIWRESKSALQRGDVVSTHQGCSQK